VLVSTDSCDAIRILLLDRTTARIGVGWIGRAARKIWREPETGVVGFTVGVIAAAWIGLGALVARKFNASVPISAPEREVESVKSRIGNRFVQAGGWSGLVKVSSRFRPCMI